MMTSLQAMSGAGRSPGVIGLDILDNVIPYIPKEEDKVEVETKKILGRSSSGASTLEPYPVNLSCTCTRVAVHRGPHRDRVSWRSADEASRRRGGGRACASGRAPRRLVTCRRLAPRWIEVLDDPFRPQPRLDRDTHGGMATTVGRLREDAVLENGIKYVLVSHNTKMGAAKGAVLVAELMQAQGLLG